MVVVSTAVYTAPPRFCVHGFCALVPVCGDDNLYREGNACMLYTFGMLAFWEHGEGNPCQLIRQFGAGQLTAVEW